MFLSFQITVAEKALGEDFSEGVYSRPASDAQSRYLMVHSFAYRCACTALRCHLNLNSLDIERNKSVGSRLQHKLGNILLRS